MRAAVRRSYRSCVAPEEADASNAYTFAARARTSSMVLSSLAGVRSGPTKANVTSIGGETEPPVIATRIG